TMAASPTPPEPIGVFCCYAHEDEPLRAELRKHLGILKRLGVIGDWHDRQLTAGSARKGHIDRDQAGEAGRLLPKMARHRRERGEHAAADSLFKRSLKVSRKTPEAMTGTPMPNRSPTP